ncbi:DUF4252 domain-containing protein [Flavobacterium sp.]|uniref:DUF4252 domain-containing protein n=1 Tax=Flavobacterium sp. TaxID=239 RepID=UPI0026113F1D|nr:DUF4252 domain-containing protein [Flavobacterium sp.]
MKSIYLVLIAVCSLFVSCNSEPTLQKFFVENQEKKDFIALDISPTILNIDKASLTGEQKKALESFDKMNVIAFKANDKNKAEYEVEKAKLNTILKDEKYQELIKVGSGSQGASVSFVGTEDNIEEFIFYANKKENGFAVVRVLGDKMNPNDVMNMMSVLQKANLDLEQLKPLQDIMK